MTMLRPALEARITAGTKKKKESYLNYWGAYCAAYSFSVDNFGRLASSEDSDP